MLEEAFTGTKPEPRYSAECIGFLKMLIEKEGYTQTMVVLLTGVPRGTIGSLWSVRSFKSKNKKGIMGGKLSVLQRARKLSRGRQKYSKELRKFFGGSQE